MPWSLVAQQTDETAVIRAPCYESRGRGKTARTRVVVALRHSGHGCIWRYVTSSSRRRLPLCSRARVFVYLEEPATISRDTLVARRTLRFTTRRYDDATATLRRHGTTARATLGVTSERQRRRALYVAISKQVFSAVRVVGSWFIAWSVVETRNHSYVYSILVRLSLSLSLDSSRTTHYSFRTPPIGFDKGHLTRDKERESSRGECPRRCSRIHRS